MTRAFGSRVGVYQRNMQNPPFRSSHLNIKDAQCAENKDGRKISYHIISRLGAVGVQYGRFVVLKIELNFIQNWPNLQQILELTCHSFFYVRFLDDRICIFSFWT